MTDGTLTAALWLGRDGQSRVGPDRIRLLEAIDAHGSIAAAARAMGLSYRTAWDAVVTLNNLLPQPVLDAAPGGRSGGGAALTPAGRALVAGFGRLEAAVGEAFARLDAHLSDGDLPAASIFRGLTMQTSTRNAFRCTVTRVTDGAVNAVVEMRLTDTHTLTAVITERSVAEMDLRVGREVIALIKASFIILAPGEVSGPVSPRNVLTGKVQSRQDGAVNSEIVIDLGDGKLVTSIITIDSADRLALQPGDTATAMFKAGHVILALV